MWKAIVLTTVALVAGASLLVVVGPMLFDQVPATPVVDSSCRDDESLLDPAQREYLWQVEHYVLLLSKYWFAELAELLANADQTGLAKALTPDFTGEVLDQPVEERLDKGFVQVVRQKNSGHSRRMQSAGEFTAYLMGWREKFSAQPKVRVIAKQLAPCDPSNYDGCWQGRGVVRMWGDMQSGQPGEVVLQFQFDLPRPVETKGQPWLRKASILQTQSMHAKHFLLRDVTRERNVDATGLHDNWTAATYATTPGGVYLCDFNRDGIVDLLITDKTRFFLYRGLPGGKFEDVTTAVGVPIDPPPSKQTTAGFIDIDGDGWEDLVLGSRVFRNQQGQEFVEYTHKTNLRIPAHASGMVVADYDRDGRVDVYFTIGGVGERESWVDGHSGLKEGNQLWRNLGNWKFENVTARSNASAGTRSVFSAVWLDANNDGWPDIYAPNEFGNGVLLLNKKDGTFGEHMIMKGPQDFGTMGIASGDVNNDGNIDLYLANMYSKTGIRIIGNVKEGTYSEDVMGKIRRFVAGSQLYLNQGALQFQPVAEDWQMNDVGWAYGPALVDLDNDGFLDVFATSGYMSVDKSKPDG